MPRKYRASKANFPKNRPPDNKKSPDRTDIHRLVFLTCICSVSHLFNIGSALPTHECPESMKLQKPIFQKIIHQPIKRVLTVLAYTELYFLLAHALFHIYLALVVLFLPWNALK